MITKDNILYASANLIAITSKDPVSGQWISNKERSYLRKIALHEKIDDHKHNLDTLLLQYFPSIMDWERAVTGVLSTCEEHIKFKAYRYMEAMAEQDDEDQTTEGAISTEEDKRIRRIVESCKIDEIAYRVKRRTIERDCVLM